MHVRLDAASFAVAPGIDEESLRECAFSLRFAKAHSLVPGLQPREQGIVNAIAHIGSELEVEFCAEKGPRYKGTAVIEHGTGLARRHVLLQS